MEDRREALTERCFKRSVMPQTSCLRYLLPDRRDSDIVNKCIGDDTKPLVKARPNCINKAKINKIWRETIINMADGIITPCNVSRSWHLFCQVTAPCNVACGCGILTVNSLSGSSLQCDTWYTILLKTLPVTYRYIHTVSIVVLQLFHVFIHCKFCPMHEWDPQFFEFLTPPPPPPGADGPHRGTGHVGRHCPYTNKIRCGSVHALLIYPSKTAKMQKFSVNSHSNENFISPFFRPPGAANP